ncbi:MAG TPA: hypothetical protein VIY52_25395 [Streptosporangiaceae bacterium]
MHAGETRSGRTDLAGARETASQPRQLSRANEDDLPMRREARRWWLVPVWIGCGTALFALLLRISLIHGLDSDGANNALQGWDMLHGNLLLHGWIIGDATYYTLELPLYAITEAVLGLHIVTAHVVSVLTFMIVAACASALAMTDSRGLARAARCLAVIAVLASPVLVGAGAGRLLEEPDHFGTSAIMMVTFLLIDRAPGRRFTSPLVCAILCAAQIGDATVRYVAVPAVLLVCAYRVLAARKIRTADAAVLLAAAASVPLSLLVRAAMTHFGAFAMVAPPTRISPAAQWPHHVALTLASIRSLFGATTGPTDPLGTVGAAFGTICLLAAAFGFARVLWTWRTASRSEQLLSAGIVMNVGAYVISTLATAKGTYEIIAVLPFGAVLAARACVPGRIAGAWRARAALAAAAAAALLPLVAAGTPPIQGLPAAPLAAWLEAHGLTYGIAGYWDASDVAVQSGNQVQVRAIVPAGRTVAPYYWESKPSWYDPSLYDATFVICETIGTSGNITPALAERSFGRPAAIYQAAGRVILIYKKNLLSELPRPAPLPTS